MTEIMSNKRAWISLREAAEMKGINYHTIMNRKHLQPNGGREDARIGGRKKWLRSTIENWISKTDEELRNTFLDVTGDKYDGQ